ncbi:MAG TPA: amidohydrolase family protein, partial [Steroidobacteraceae bacterium]
MGNTLENITNWRARYATGELVGPRILPAGLIDGVGPNTTNGVHVSTSEQLSKAITLFADNGYIEIKLYSSFPKELIPAAVRQAHSRGLRVGGHVPVGLRLDDAVRLGFDDISHFNFVMLNFLDDATQNKTNTLARVLEPAARAGAIDLDSPAVGNMIQAMQDRHVALDSTALVFENLFGAAPGTLRAAYAPYGDRLPARIIRAGRGGGLAKTDAERATYTHSFEHMLPLLKRMHDAGIALVPGTDGEPGVLLARELELYVKSGIGALDALQMATLVPARMMRLDQDLGSIAPGKLADLFLVDGDPSQDIGAVRNVELVVRDGIFYDAVALNEAIGIRPRNSRIKSLRQ